MQSKNLNGNTEKQAEFFLGKNTEKMQKYQTLGLLSYPLGKEEFVFSVFGWKQNHSCIPISDWFHNYPPEFLLLQNCITQREVSCND